ncbi:hypothetical protein BGZ49_008326 [Haplosporangium sp. Z 27]|nr:hypothetical protein BGZ49_008326 [Haplosporangium sp. Z 27]
MKRVAACLIILIIVLVSTVNLEVKYYTWRNRLDLEVKDLQIITAGPSSSSINTTPHKYGIYMYLGCTVSPFASVLWHVTQAVKVCDSSNSDRLCDVKMKKDYDYTELAFKAKEWLLSDRFSEMLDQNEVIVKLDDDTIISKDILDGMVDEFMRSDCKFAGVMRENPDGLFWVTGSLFLVKAGYLKQQLRDNVVALDYYRQAEDVQISDLLNIRDRKSVCNLDMNVFKHRYYEDHRMLIRYKPYIKCQQKS